LGTKTGEGIFVGERLREDWIVVCYYTNDNYLKEADRLVRSLKKFNVEYVLRKREHLDSWLKNCHQKPKFLREMFEELQRPLLYMDADSEMMKYPYLVDNFTHDIGIYRKTENSHRSASLYMKCNPWVLEFIRGWERTQEKRPELCDQRALDVWITYLENERKVGPLKEIGYLPVEFCTKFDGTQGKVEDAIILQHQASRKYK